MIEDVQKVNKLAQELLNQGIAFSRDEAVKKAQEFLNKEITSDQRVTQENRVQTQAIDITLESLKNIFERHKEITQRQFNDFRSAINALAENVSNIKEQMIMNKVEARTAKEAGFEPEQKTGQLKLEPKKEEKKEVHPKRGEWKSSDVSIEKMFYYGTK